MSEQKQKQLSCPNCSQHDIIKVESYNANVFDEYTIDYNGEIEKKIDNYYDDEKETEVWFMCSDCKYGEYTGELEEFQEG